MREEYGYAVAMSTGVGREIVDLEKREFGFIVSQVSKVGTGPSDFMARPGPPASFSSFHSLDTWNIR
jgi:hypothetical protein